MGVHVNVRARTPAFDAGEPAYVDKMTPEPKPKELITDLDTVSNARVKECLHTWQYQRMEAFVTKHIPNLRLEDYDIIPEADGLDLDMSTCLETITPDQGRNGIQQDWI